MPKGEVKLLLCTKEKHSNTAPILATLIYLLLYILSPLEEKNYFICKDNKAFSDWETMFLKLIKLPEMTKC